jgi:hypothetical protein
MVNKKNQSYLGKEKKELIDKLWKVAETGEFKSYSKYRKEKDFLK